MSEPHLHGRDGFTVLHVKELILFNESINVRLLDIVGSLVKSFQRVTHSLSGFTMRDGVILIHPKIGYEYVL